MFQPHFEILPSPQIALWPELAEVPSHFVLYEGTALALRLGHRQLLDFDFFTTEPVIPAELLKKLEDTGRGENSSIQEQLQGIAAGVQAMPEIQSISENLAGPE